MEVGQIKRKLGESEKKQSLYRDEIIAEIEENRTVKRCIEILSDQANILSAKLEELLMAMPEKEGGSEVGSEKV